MPASPSAAEIALLRTQFFYAQTPEQRRAALAELRRRGLDPTARAPG